MTVNEMTLNILNHEAGACCRICHSHVLKSIKSALLVQLVAVVRVCRDIFWAAHAVPAGEFFAAVPSLGCLCWLNQMSYYILS